MKTKTLETGPNISSSVPQSSNLKFEVDRNLFPFRSNFLEVEKGIEVHYVDEGPGRLSEFSSQRIGFQL